MRAEQAPVAEWLRVTLVGGSGDRLLPSQGRGEKGWWSGMEVAPSSLAQIESVTGLVFCTILQLRFLRIRSSEDLALMVHVQ